MAVHGSSGDTVPKGGIDCAGGEEARKQCTQSAACAVHAEGIERIVVTQAALDFKDHE